LIDNVSKGNLPSVECIIHFFVVVCCVVEGKILWRELSETITPHRMRERK